MLIKLASDFINNVDRLLTSHSKIDSNFDIDLSDNEIQILTSEFCSIIDADFEQKANNLYLIKYYIDKADYDGGITPIDELMPPRILISAEAQMAIDRLIILTHEKGHLYGLILNRQKFKDIVAFLFIEVEAFFFDILGCFYYAQKFKNFLPLNRLFDLIFKIRKRAIFILENNVNDIPNNLFSDEGSKIKHFIGFVIAIELVSIYLFEDKQKALCLLKEIVILSKEESRLDILNKINFSFNNGFEKVTMNLKKKMM